jgi:hypothetical protein
MSGNIQVAEDTLIAIALNKIQTHFSMRNGKLHEFNASNDFESRQLCGVGPINNTGFREPQKVVRVSLRIQKSINNHHNHE